MRRSQRRIALLALPALVGSILVTTGPAGADPTGAVSRRQPDPNLEDRESVRLVHIKLTGADMLDKVAAAGFDLEHGLRRVPNGIEGEAVVTAEQVTELKAMGVEVLGDDAGFAWSDEADGGLGRRRRPPRGAAPPANRRRRRYASSAPTGSPRRARASSTSRRAPPRAQQTDPIVGMQLENDSGKGTAVRLRRGR